MKTAIDPKATAINILTANLTDNDVFDRSAHQFANYAREQVMVTSTRQSPAKHKQSATKGAVKKTVTKKVTPKAELIVKVKPISSTKLISHLEDGVNLQFQMLAIKLLSQFDMSPETAKANSYGSQHFRSHNLLAKNGASKQGKHQSLQRVLLDRYISYRVGDFAFKFTCLLLDDRDPHGVRFQVEGDPKFFKKASFKTPKELRPYLNADDNMGAAHGGQEFTSFEKAADFFEKLIAKVAPRIH
jgi:predicted transcriptional regulator